MSSRKQVKLFVPMTWAGADYQPGAVDMPIDAAVYAVRRGFAAAWETAQSGTGAVVNGNDGNIEGAQGNGKNYTAAEIREIVLDVLDEDLMTRVRPMIFEVGNENLPERFDSALVN